MINANSQSNRVNTYISGCVNPYYYNGLDSTKYCDTICTIGERIGNRFRRLEWIRYANNQTYYVLCNNPCYTCFTLSNSDELTYLRMDFNNQVLKAGATVILEGVRM